VSAVADAAPRAGLAASALAEWSVLVSTAVIGTDRRVPTPAEAGWQPWGSSTDPAVALLDRATAVVVARRAGARPHPSPSAALPLAPADPRPACPPQCAARLERILAGEHDVLLPEWLHCCDTVGAQLPWAALPTLLLRGRRHTELDQVVRSLAGGRATWLAEVLPELGVRTTRATTATSSAPPPNGPAVTSVAPWGRPPAPADSGAAMSGVVQVFVDGLATWAAAPQLRLITAALVPDWLPPLIAQLSQLGFHAATERTRADVLALAEFRLAMLHEFHAAATLLPAATSADRPVSRQGDHP
jgi:hypothetical protein